MRRRLSLVLLLSVPLLGTLLDVPGQAAERTERSVTVQSLHWEQVPLGEALQRLSQAVGIKVFVDRRVDPHLRINLEVSDATDEEILRQVAAAADLGASLTGPLAYIGPPTAASQLRTLAAVRDDEIGALPADLRDSLRRRQPLDWPRLSEPRQLAARLIEDRDWRIAGSERIPHDLWAAGSMNGLSFAEQLTMLLVGFDLTFDLHPSERAIEILPLALPVSLSRRYRWPEALGGEVLQQQFPDAAAQFAGNEVAVAATLEDHERLAELLRGQKSPRQSAEPRRSTRRVYTLRVQEQPVGVVLEQLKQRLGWNIEIDETAMTAAGRSLNQRVSFSVRNADEDELLRALLAPAELDFQRDGERVTIVPK